MSLRSLLELLLALTVASGYDCRLGTVVPCALRPIAALAPRGRFALRFGPVRCWSLLYSSTTVQYGYTPYCGIERARRWIRTRARARGLWGGKLNNESWTVLVSFAASHSLRGAQRIRGFIWQRCCGPDDSQHAAELWTPLCSRNVSCSAGIALLA